MSTQFFFRTADVTGSIALGESRQMVMPGDNAEVECTLISPMAVQVRTIRTIKIRLVCGRCVTNLHRRACDSRFVKEARLLALEL